MRALYIEIPVYLIHPSQWHAEQRGKGCYSPLNTELSQTGLMIDKIVSILTTITTVSRS
jgi:hypothetical protein